MGGDVAPAPVAAPVVAPAPAATSGPAPSPDATATVVANAQATPPPAEGAKPDATTTPDKPKSESKPESKPEVEGPSWFARNKDHLKTGFEVVGALSKLEGGGGSAAKPADSKSRLLLAATNIK